MILKGNMLKILLNNLIKKIPAVKKDSLELF